jgi:hypothetical protein
MKRLLLTAALLTCSAALATEPQIYWLSASDRSTPDTPPRPLGKQDIERLTLVQTELATSGALVMAWCPLFEAGGDSKAGRICDGYHRLVDVSLDYRRILFDDISKLSGRTNVNVCEALIIDKDALMASAKKLRAEADKLSGDNEILTAVAIKVREYARSHEADADKMVASFRQSTCPSIIAQIYYPKPKATPATTAGVGVLRPSP